MNDSLDFDFDDGPREGFAMRPYQVECCNAVERGRSKSPRQLVVLPCGTGKTLIFSRLARNELGMGGRALILAHTDELCDQAHDKLLRSTGLTADREKAEAHASLESPVVIASIQSISKVARLTRFPDNHFSLVVADECDLSLSVTWARVLGYFHFGSASLAPDFVAPAVGTAYPFLAHVLGVTATPIEAMGNFYPAPCFEYGMIEAVKDGYLARPIVRNIPLKIDLRKIKLSRTAHGVDLDLAEVIQRISPVIREIARNLAVEVRNMKTVCFMPSIETARQLAEQLAIEGMNAKFVSGECPDRKEKVAWFRAAGPGSILCNAMLLSRGVDVEDVTAVCVLRPSRIWRFVVQCWLRGSRLLPHIIDGIETAEERRKAIAASAKDRFTIIDFLWLTDRIDLISPVDLVATKPEIRKNMLENGEVDLMAAESKAQKDLLASLAKAARKHAMREARTIDPLAYAMSLGDTVIKDYKPESVWEKDDATSGQLTFLRRQGLNVEGIKTKGLANKLINRVMYRMKRDMATPRQLDLMRRLGLTDQETSTLTRIEASAVIDRIIGKKTT